MFLFLMYYWTEDLVVILETCCDILIEWFIRMNLSKHRHQRIFQKNEIYENFTIVGWRFVLFTWNVISFSCDCCLDVYSNCFLPLILQLFFRFLAGLEIRRILMCLLVSAYVIRVSDLWRNRTFLCVSCVRGENEIFSRRPMKALRDWVILLIKHNTTKLLILRCKYSPSPCCEYSILV